LYSEYLINFKEHDYEMTMEEENGKPHRHCFF